MGKYIAGRLLLGIPTVFGVSLIIFFSLRVLPGDVLDAMFGPEGGARIAEQDRQRIMEQLRLDKPLYVQYWDWASHIVRGDMGRSVLRGTPIAPTLIRRAMISAEIAVIAVVLSWVIGLPIGILSALKRETLGDYGMRIFVVALLAIPGFWLASLIVLVGVLQFGWSTPVGGVRLPWVDPLGNLQQVLPGAFVIGLGASALIARMSRSTFLEVIREDYIRTARAKGLAEGSVVIRHALRNAVMPVITLSATAMAHLLGGAVTVEFAFGVPGLGTALTSAIAERDFIVIQALAIIYGTTFVLVNLAVDVSYAWIDPRVRY
ncbi:MAG: ABC transporter permease [Chloroflexi bacterium]|nr:ABC transporter permease [Chloroflexota bacterium]